MNPKKHISFILAIILVLSFTSMTFAQTRPEKSAVTIITIRVKGNEAISTATILSKIKSEPGSSLSQDVINDDVKRLYALGYFSDVIIDVEDYKEGVMLTIIVKEKPVIKEVIFKGNKRIRTPRLKKLIQTKEGDMLNYGKLTEDISEIKSLYGKNGFHMVDAEYILEMDKTLNQTAVTFIVDEKTRARVKRILIEGNKTIKTREIRALMKTKPAWFFNRGYFDDETFEDDLSKIAMYYQNNGFLDVVIEPKFDYDKEQEIMIITLTIEEGKQYHVGKVIIEGKTVLPESDLRNKITIKEGDVFSAASIRENVGNVRNFYYQKGYVNAELFVDRVLNPRTQDLDIVFTINGKEVVHVGKIDIKGNTKTKDVVIRRELRVYPGERFDGDKIRRSKERLYNLGFFEDVFFETKSTEKPNVSDLEVSVKESKTGEFSFGGGYSSVDEFIGFVQIMQKNFDILGFPYFTGDGQNLVIRAELGTTRRDFDISWTEPWIFDFPLSFGFDAYHRTHFRRTQVGYGYQEIRSGGDVRLGKEFLEYFRGNLMYRLEQVDISDVSTEATADLRDEIGKNWLSSLTLGLQFDNRDNVFSPTKGMVIGASAENTGGFLSGDKDFIKSYFWSSLYISPIKKIVIELRGRAGFANSYGDSDEVPIYSRFYAGGANTIRGYEERRVGPRDPGSSDPIGGEATLIGNVELIVPIYENLLKAAVFYDVGNVWRRTEDFAQGDYKQGVGVGIRVKTPIGPIKIDWGYPLSENQGDAQKGQFYFSASHGF